MFGVVMFVGWGATAVLVAVEWVRRRPHSSWVVGLLLGLLLGVLWPLTGWVAGGLWWSRRHAVRPVDHASAVAQAEAMAAQARVEGMPSSAAYWTCEAARRRAAAGAAPPVRRPQAGVAAVCTAGVVLTFVLIGSVTPAPTPEPAAAGVVAPAPALPPAPVERPADRVVEVVDGDTVVVEGAGGPVTVRLLGIDTPEAGAAAECGAAESTGFARSALLLQEVRLVSDPTQAVRDEYGRTLAYVELPDGTDFSVAVVRAGLARPASYAGPVQRHARIAAAEQQARAANDGHRDGCWAPPPAPTRVEPAPEIQAAPDAVPADPPADEPPAAAPPPASREAEPVSDCDPNYGGGCVPIASDVDCAGGSGNGPEYVEGPVDVVREDVYGLDADDDGVGCE